MKTFLSHKSTKDQLTSYLAGMVTEGYQSSEKTVIVAHHQSVLSNGIDVHHLESSHEEADTKIILHAADAVTRGVTKLDILSPDTHVLVLCIRRLADLTTDKHFIKGT